MRSLKFCMMITLIQYYTSIPVLIIFITQVSTISCENYVVRVVAHFDYDTCFTWNALSAILGLSLCQRVMPAEQDKCALPCVSLPSVVSVLSCSFLMFLWTVWSSTECQHGLACCLLCVIWHIWRLLHKVHSGIQTGCQMHLLKSYLLSN